MKHFFFFFFSVLLSAPAGAQIFSEHFDSLSAVVANGWLRTNNSNPAGSTGWAQGTQAIGTSAYSGSPTAYFETSYLAVNNSGTISDWLISPAIVLNDGDSVSFYAVSYNSYTYPDRLECRLSPAGGSNPGTTATSTGDFSQLIFSINPSLDTSSFPSIVGGGNWKRFSGAVSGLGGPTSVRIGLRYFVTNGGSNAANASVIGVDEFEAFPPVGIAETNALSVHVFPNPSQNFMQIDLGRTGNYHCLISDATGRVCAEETFGESTKTITVAHLSPGIYFLQITDLSGARGIYRFVKK